MGGPVRPEKAERVAELERLAKEGKLSDAVTDIIFERRNRALDQAEIDRMARFAVDMAELGRMGTEEMEAKYEKPSRQVSGDEGW